MSQLGGAANVGRAVSLSAAVTDPGTNALNGGHDDLRRVLKAFPPVVILRDTAAPPLFPTARDIRYSDLRLVTSADADGGLTAV